MDYRSILLISGVLILLVCVTVVVAYLRRRAIGIDSGVLSTCRSRVYAWWFLFGALTCAVLLGTIATVVLFGIVSFWALREYMTLTPTRPADHRTLVGVFFLLTPLQFVLVGVDSEWFFQFFHVESSFVYSVLIPSLAFLILPATIAVSDDPKYFLERIAKLQVGLLICVYSLSFAPAIMTIDLHDFAKISLYAPEIQAVDIEDKVLKPIEDVVVMQNVSRESDITDIKGNDSEVVEASNNLAIVSQDDSKKEIDAQLKTPTPHKKINSVNLTLLFVFVILTQVNDVAQYFWSLAFPKHKIASNVNSNKTTEGVALGMLTTALVAVAFLYFTPFANWRQAALAGVIISIMGFAGNMTISAIKRDQGVGEYGELVEGHSGVLDRIDSLCFAAPVFYHYVRLCMN